MVCTNACKEGLDEVLMQEGHVIYYKSRKLNEDERDYVTCDLELPTIVHALKMWKHYFLGRKFILMSYHRGLRCLFDHSKLNVGHGRWISLISEFDYEIKYIKEKENKVSDLLRRSLQLDHVATIDTNATIKRRYHLEKLTSKKRLNN